MSASSTEIANQALSYLGISTEIQDLATDRSKEAKACRAFYGDTRDEVLRDYVWPFATTIEALGLVAENPTDEWAFSYQYPADCLKLKRILNAASRIETQETKIPYRLIHGETGLLIYTGQPDAVAEFTVRVATVERYPPDFVSSLALLLASKIAPRVTGGDPYKLGLQALQKYAIRLGLAVANANNEEQPDVPADGEFVRARS